MTKLGSRKLHICLKVTKMGSIIGHRIDYNGVGAMRGLRGQRHIPTPPRLRLQIKRVFMYVWRRLVRDRRVTSLPELVSWVSQILLHLKKLGELLSRIKELARLVALYSALHFLGQVNFSPYNQVGSSSWVKSVKASMQLRCCQLLVC